MVAMVWPFLRKIVLSLVHMQFGKLYTHSAPSEIASQFPPTLRLNKLIYWENNNLEEIFREKATIISSK
jgi:hypothetical protein